jgi:NAD(P)-dependent dehydrogenase (short-subunit alcohol dehydrogenase family)
MGGSGINVNAIAPGYMATNNTQQLRDDEQRSQAILDRIPAGRWGYRMICKARWCSWRHRHQTTLMVTPSR